MHSDSFKPLPREFYTGKDVVKIARDLLGKVIYTYVENTITTAIITETEAYEGITDKASHAYNNRRTARTEIMYWKGGHAYVYLCYGIHSLFNIVTSVQSEPHAVLVRAIEPLSGVENMKIRSGKHTINHKSGIGPGNVSKLLGIKVAHSGIDLCPVPESHKEIWVQDVGLIVPEDEMKISTRIGIDYAKEDALLPYRFQWIKNKKAP